MKGNTIALTMQTRERYRKCNRAAYRALTRNSERLNEYILMSCMVAKKFTEGRKPITGIHYIHAVRWGFIGCAREGKATDS